MASIYGLLDPRDGSLRYIGKANNPEDRLKGHMRDSERKSTPVYRWIRKVGKPRMVVLIHDCADWREDEKRLISEARERGDRLLNVADGGDEPYCPTEVRSENARKATESRPSGVMRAYRAMEFHIREARKTNDSRLESFISRYNQFKERIKSARSSGSIAEIDAKLIQYFQG